MRKSIPDRILSGLLGALAALGGFVVLPYAFLAIDNWKTFRSYKDSPISGWQSAFPVLATWALTLIAFYVAARFLWYAFSKAKPD